LNLVISFVAAFTTWSCFQQYRYSRRGMDYQPC